jgi:hypothetical protein
MAREMDPEGRAPNTLQSLEEDIPLFLQMPLTVGISIRNPLFFAGFLAAAKAQLQNVLPGGLDWEPMEPAYKDVNIVRIRAKENGEIARHFKDKPQPALYYALIDGGWYISLRPEPIKDLIDQSVARKEGKEVKKGETVDINNSLYIAPGSAKQAGDFLQGYLEWETHRRAIANAPLWQCLYEGSLIAPGAEPAIAERAARNFLGFVPVSPDGSAYVYDGKSNEVTNRRHGSPRQPRLNQNLADESPLKTLLGQFQSIRADLRFREDGIHTVLSIGKKPAKP